MKRVRPIVRRGRASEASALRATPSLTVASAEAVSHFVRILARCGASTEDIREAVHSACDAVPEAWMTQGQRAAREIGDASHVLTVWYSDLRYLDQHGKPRALAASGRAPSLTTLVAGVDSRLDAAEVLAYLVRVRAVKSVAGGYVPRSRSLLLRGAQGPDYFRTLRVLANTLATLEHNVLPREAVRGWFEYFAENPNFPVARREALDAFVIQLGKEILARIDAYMHRCEIERDPQEPVVRVGVGMQLWEGEPGAKSRAARKSVKRRRRK